MKKSSSKPVEAGKRVRVRRQKPSAGTFPGNAVFLVGFMGAGKSSVGRALALRLNWIFEDLDDRIEQREGRTVPEIFRESGEAAFRQAEHTALAQVLEEVRGGVARIIALGGGAFVQPENARQLRSAGVATVFLDAPADELWRRCCQQASEVGTERPLLRSMEEFRRLYEMRRKSYLQASLKIATGGREIEAVATEVAELLGLKAIAVRTEQGEVE